ncbi:beta-1,3-galactosyltransferase 1-like [Physella acuta]|uniref:beta-1,3-galactosyltransferase 1-like n=1 Tax=Physella acuta TaxID=109671 RepID=UPI0027DC8DC8|nr:beta-1,3-galactosyltransferase 1-like [Physella acuta]
MTPSKLLLEDLYFLPSSHNFQYYNNSVLVEPNACSIPNGLVIFVPSHPRSGRQRMAIRETWGSMARGKSWPHLDPIYNIQLIFVLGQAGNVTHHNTSEDQQEQTPTAIPNFLSNSTELYNGSTEADNNVVSTTEEPTLDELLEWEESLTRETDSFHDILQFQLLDSYANLTRKLILAFNWLLHSTCKCSYVLKVDQDVFVNIPMLITFLEQSGKPNSIYGHIYANSWVERKGKWAVSKIDLPIDKYPIYAAGNAYVLSIDAVDKIVKLSPHFPYIPVEDAFLTGILASVAGVDRIMTGGFTKWSESTPHACEFVNYKRYVGNNMTEFMHRAIWRELVDVDSGRCKT